MKKIGGKEKGWDEIFSRESKGLKLENSWLILKLEMERIIKKKKNCIIVRIFENQFLNEIKLMLHLLLIFTCKIIF